MAIPPLKEPAPVNLDRREAVNAFYAWDCATSCVNNEEEKFGEARPGGSLGGFPRGLAACTPVISLTLPNAAFQIPLPFGLVT